MSRLSWSLVSALCWCVLFAETSRADTFLYTFDSPNFTLGQMTPLGNIAPNVGASSFTTSFTDLTVPNGYQIASIPEDVLISGQSLLGTSTTALQLTFNTPITQLVVNFAIDLVPANPPGFLQLVTPSGTLDQASSNVGGGLGFQGGILTFTTAVPFTTATLQGFSSGNSPVEINIDNLALTTPVPEPSTLVLVGLGVFGLVGWRHRRGHQVNARIPVISRFVG